MKKFYKRLGFVMVLALIVQLILPLASQAFVLPGGSNLDVANWMGDKQQYLGNRRLNQIALPGTHDSGVYSLNENSWDGIDNGFADFLNIERWPIIKRIIKNYSLTQTRTVNQQLMDGNRYLDIRFKRNEYGAIRIYHGMFGPTVDEIFNQIADYVNSHPKEIVIIDLQDLHNLTNSDMDYVYNVINNKIGSRLANRNTLSPSSTYNQFLRAGTNVIILTDKPYLYSKGNGFWDRDGSIVSNWLNTSDGNRLVQHLTSDLANKNNSKFYVSQMVLSPSGGDIKYSIIDKLKRFDLIGFGRYVNQLINQSLATMLDPYRTTLNNWVYNADKKTLNITMRDFYEFEHIINTINNNNLPWW